MIGSLQRALKDIKQNQFLNTVTVMIIAFSVLIDGALELFLYNADHMVEHWKSGIRIMVYLKPGTNEAKRLDTKYELQKITHVEDALFVSKGDAMNKLKSFMKGQISFLENLDHNPLPDAFEIVIDTNAQQSKDMEMLASQIRSLPAVEDVQYGQRWIERFTSLYGLFKIAGWTLTGLFFMATLFIVANTIRLVLYSRRSEIEVMRLVGATDQFIKKPFYLQGLLQGAAGALIGIGAMFFFYLIIRTRFSQGFTKELLTIQFFDFKIICDFIGISMFVGWLGSYISLRQFLKN